MERFNKKYMRNASTPSIQQPCGQPNKAMPQKAKKAKSKQVNSMLYFIES
jgi:hypothetical protein